MGVGARCRGGRGVYARVAVEMFTGWSFGVVDWALPRSLWVPARHIEVGEVDLASRKDDFWRAEVVDNPQMTSRAARERRDYYVLAAYNADGGLVGEARYVVGHLLGRTECQLATSPTHPSGASGLGLPSSRASLRPSATRHRNELTAYTQGVIDPMRLPAGVCRLIAPGPCARS